MSRFSEPQDPAFQRLNSSIAFDRRLWPYDIQQSKAHAAMLVAGGYSLLLLAFFYIVVDGLQWRRTFIPFIWIGMNPITLYLLDNIINYQELKTTLFGGPFADAFGAWREVVLACGVVVINLAVAWFLYSRKIFLKV